MSDRHLTADLRRFNSTYRTQLEEAARTLEAGGVRRVHYGVDYVNDDGDAADYAVYEYADGRSIMVDTWPAELAYEVFVTGVGYCQPYTFEVASAAVMLDKHGGQVDVEEGVIRTFHTPAQREALEAQAQAASALELFNATFYQELAELRQALTAQNVEVVHFGVDAVGSGDGATYPLGDWCVLVADGEERVTSLHPAIADRAEIWAELPAFGAFTFDVDMAWISEDKRGGIVKIRADLTRAYHTDEQRAALTRGP